MVAMEGSRVGVTESGDLMRPQQYRGLRGLREKSVSSTLDMFSFRSSLESRRPPWLDQSEAPEKRWDQRQTHPNEDGPVNCRGNEVAQGDLSERRSFSRQASEELQHLTKMQS